MADTLLNIPLSQITDRKLPLRQRTDAGRLEDLMSSIQRYGVIEPIIVSPAESGYQLVIGRRRVEACLKLGLSTIPAIVRRVSEDRARELSFQSNLQVQPLNIADEVDFLRRIDILLAVPGVKSETID